MIEIKLPQFPTHVPYTSNKKAPDKYIKVNNQNIYNGAIARFGRNTAVKNLHHFFLAYMPSDVKAETPVKILYTIKTVVNHGAIQRRKGEIMWKYPSDKYVPNWDIENLAGILIKTGNDSLVKARIIPDDSIEFLTNIEYEYVQVDDIDNREIIIKIYEKGD